jgi:hypothetical protein
MKLRKYEANGLERDAGGKTNGGVSGISDRAWVRWRGAPWSVAPPEDASMVGFYKRKPSVCAGKESVSLYKEGSPIGIHRLRTKAFLTTSEYREYGTFDGPRQFGRAVGSRAPSCYNTCLPGPRYL